MSKKKLAKASYTNISKKARKEKIAADRGETFVGCRPTYFKDKTKYDRKRFKKISLDY